MESAVRKSDKENTKPRCGSKMHVNSNTVSKQRMPCKSAPPLQSKNSLKEDNSRKGEDKNVGTKSKMDNAHPSKRQTLSQAFHSKQTTKHQKLVEEFQKPSTVSTIQKSKPGIYKGRVVQSKIDCYRKAAVDVKTREKKEISKPDIIRAKSELPKARSKSVTSTSTFIKTRVNSAPPSRPKSVSDVRVNVTQKQVQKSVSHKQLAQKTPGQISVSHHACFLPKPAPQTTGCSSFKKPVLSKKKEMLVPEAKPKRTTTEQKVRRPVTSTISQYRVQMETAEERRAKLADWLASKGKTLKRPPIPETSQKPAMKTQTGPKPTTRAQPNLESAKETLAANSKNPKDVKDPENQPMSPAGSTNIMNITLDLLDDEEEEDPPADTEITLESLVLNLCDKLDAMETPSSCEDGGRLLTVNGVEMQVGEHEADKGFEIIDEEELLDENTSDEAETVCIKNNDHEVPEKKLFDGEDDGDDTDTSPEMESASIVKYNVKTTPYLQSVKKRIECEMAPESGSRRKSMIKDLKFLTPVRRSTRIQRTSSRLPGMLNDHDTCISSLAELVKLEGADASAYIYRKNSALLEDLPDQSGDLAKVCL